MPCGLKILFTCVAITENVSSLKISVESQTKQWICDTHVKTNVVLHASLCFPVDFFPRHNDYLVSFTFRIHRKPPGVRLTS